MKRRCHGVGGFYSRRDHAIAQISEEFSRTAVPVSVEDPGKSSEEVEHARLLLIRDDDRLHGDRRAIRDDRARLLQHTLRIRNVRDDEPRHAREQRDRLVRRSASELLEVEDDRDVVALAELIAQRVEHHLSIG